MKKKPLHFRLALFILTFFVLSANYLTAQWSVYDGSSLPQQNNPAFVVKDNSPEVDFSAESILDADISGNFLFEYKQPTLAGKTTYRYDIPESFSQFTLVTRVKGIPGATADDYFRIMEFDLRSSQESIGNKFEIRYDDTLSLDKPDIGDKVIIALDSLDGWHLYRFTMDGKNFRLYVDEHTTPILEGVSDRERLGDNYFKFCDGSTSYSVGGTIDWIIWNDSTAWAPGEGTPIPSELSTDHVEIELEPEEPEEPEDTTTSINLNHSIEQQTKLYPSFATDYANLTVHDELVNGNIILINVLGVEVSNRIISAKSTKINLESYPKGYYTVLIKRNNQHLVRRLIIR